jgi:hypothetical protein
MFSGAEYFCVECGLTFGMFGTEREDLTPELKKRHAKNERKWKPINKGLLTGGVMFRWCDECSKTSDAHLNHATPEELEAHKKALEKLEKIGT